ncbi:alpha/beta fold hydrolase [Streptomyces sp. NPDC060194]|uniref:alpha/beta fold hydrolase n=1 Tax=Streptomyces sp. NPDC060194 TaxID=3347069 RepID=UPI00364A5C1D
MSRVELSAGPVDYQDTGGDGPVVVFCHGVPMNEQVWRKVVPLMAGYRCVLPTLPLGGHRTPMRPDADLSHRGVAALVGEFVDELGLEDVTLVLNDWGGGQFLLLDRSAGANRIGRLVLVACEAFDNFPPGPAKAMAVVARIPGGMLALVRLMRLRAVRHARRGYGGMSLRGIPDAVLRDWFAPADRDPAIRRDFAKFAVSAPGRRTLLSWFERLRTFDRPVLVLWATEDPLMPREHGPRLAALYPHARLVEIPDSATLVPEDQPECLAAELRAFLTESGAAARGAV